MILEEHPYIDRLIIPTYILGDKKYYLYAHMRIDTDQCFYIGIGTKYRKKDFYRAVDFKKRNVFWKKIANKTRYNVIIVDESDNHQEIINKEINYILILGKKKDKKGELTNITDGGEGLKGHKVTWTKEMREAASERLKHREIKESTREKLRENIKTREFYGQSAKYVSKPIYKVDVNTGEALEEFLNCVEAGKKYNITASSIQSAIKNNFTSVGFKWKYKNKELQDLIDYKLNNKVKKERKKTINSQSKKVIGININSGEEKIFTSLRDAGKFIGVHHQKVGNICNKEEIINNYKWKYGTS